MATSGTSAVVAGILFGAPVPIIVLVALVWGVTVVADSAQFSSAVSELAPPGTAGSALSVQTAVGFTLTSVTILGVGLLDPMGADGWRLGLDRSSPSARSSGSSRCGGCAADPTP